MTTADGASAGADRLSAPADATPIEMRLRRAGLPPLQRLSWLEVDIGILAENARVIRRLLPHGTREGIVVKAGGYGHGMIAAALAAIEGGADLLLVATLDEALALRAARIVHPTLVLYPVPPETIRDAAEADIELVVADEASLRDMLRATRAEAEAEVATRPRVRVHLAIDSGMTRGGFPPAAAADAAQRLGRAPGIELVGVWSHLASPEDPRSVDAQVERFDAALEALARHGFRLTAHLAASGGLFGTAPAYDLVRVGLAFYGILPPELEVGERARDLAAALRPALSLKARAMAIAEVPAGTAVGYGETWRAERPSTIATLPVGYADGFVRLYSPGASALVGGRRVPVVGRVSSDAVAVDVTDVEPLLPDAELVLLGEQAGERIDAQELADLRRSIAWEVLDAFGDRLARVYVRDGAPVAVLPPYGRLVDAPAAATATERS